MRQSYVYEDLSHLLGEKPYGIFSGKNGYPSFFLVVLLLNPNEGPNIPARIAPLFEGLYSIKMHFLGTRKPGSLDIRGFTINISKKRLHSVWVEISEHIMDTRFQREFMGKAP